MSSPKSPLYSVLGVIFGLVVLAGGAAKFYRGISGLADSKSDPRVKALLEESDAAVESANRETDAIGSAFQELLTDFDTLGVTTFRAERQEACSKLRQQFANIVEHLQLAANKIMDATKLGTDAEVTPFLMAKAKSYELLVKVSQQNIDIIQAVLDESTVDTDAIVKKVQSIAANRALDETAAAEATAAADALLKRS